MNIRYDARVDEAFTRAPFKSEIEASLTVIDSCGHPVCIQIFPWEAGIDEITLMLRKDDGGPFPNSPLYGQFKLSRSAYEGEVSSQQEALHTLNSFVKVVENLLNDYGSD